MMSSASKNRNSTHQAVKLTWIFICRSLFNKQYLFTNKLCQQKHIQNTLYKCKSSYFFIRGIDNQIQSETLLYK